MAKDSIKAGAPKDPGPRRALSALGGVGYGADRPRATQGESRLPDHIDTDAVIAQLNRLPRTHSALHVTMFKCFRETADGRSQEVTVEIYDSGPDVLEQTRRYYCVARGEDGKATSANTADSVTKVLATMHRGDLD